MDSLREYVISVTAAAVLCGCIRQIAGQKGSAAPLVKLICGLFLTLTVISPVKQIQFSDFAVYSSEMQLEAAAATAMGKDFTREALENIIKQELSAYILDKAAGFQANIQVEFSLSQEDPPVPLDVTIRGKVDSNAKAKLQEILEEELGIPKEDQRWIE